MNNRVEPVTREAVQLLLDGTICLSAIETNGIKIDTDLLNNNITQTENEITQLQHKLTTYAEYKIWRKMFGSTMKLSSRLQCSYVLFDNIVDENGKNISRKGNMGYKCELFTDTGRAEVSEESLLAAKSEFVHDYLRYLSLQKVLATYLYGIRDELDTKGFLHPSFNLGGVSSYRSSCVAKGTLIMVNRDYAKNSVGVPIEEVKAGDYVFCFDDELKPQLRKVLWAGKTGRREVVRVHFKRHRGFAGYIDVTPEHLIRMADGTYVEAKNIMNYVDEDYGCIVLSITKHNHVVVKVEQLQDQVDVYDIHVEEFHNFIANEICVHNSENPNFQNMPVRDVELAKLVRSCFVPRVSGNCFVEIDYSGSEVKCAAAYHHDRRMLRYLSDKTSDMHRDMACQCFMLPPERVSKPIRNITKGGFVFAAFYGSYWVGIAARLWSQSKINDLKTVDGEFVLDHLAKCGITELGEIKYGKPTPGSFFEHIKKIESDFWGNRFSEYNQWKKKTWSQYLKDGYVDFLSGFRCSGVFTRNEVLNLPIQGLSFHCLLWSLNLLHKELQRRKMKTLLIGQIHDSIVADVPENELQSYLELASEIMIDKLHEHWDFLVARMEVEADVSPKGCSWFDKKPYKIDRKID
ncbi:MAG: hypothetical protein LBP59_11255 [Planctomycetaceae bacterium]|jgi:DNA polymerase I-like protein with 3'-5' exonuclease and polymerase domains|nr:hypothetical protein [Planctomycetaceae bacterium]